jgi:hypothetical protein
VVFVCVVDVDKRGVGRDRVRKGEKGEQNTEMQAREALSPFALILWVRVVEIADTGAQELSTV